MKSKTLNPRSVPRSRLGRMGLLLVLTGGTLAAMTAAYVAHGRWAARQFKADLATLETGEVVAYFRELAGRGEPGITAVVDALNADQPRVALAAAEALDRQIDDSALLPHQAAQRRLTQLATALASRSESFGPSAQHEVVRLTMRLLLWPIDGSELDGRKLIASCERVLRANVVNPSQTVGPDRIAPTPTLAATRSTAARSAGSTNSSRSIHPLRPDAVSLALPGGGLPFDSAGLSPASGLPHADSTASLSPPTQAARPGPSGNLSRWPRTPPKRLPLAPHDARPLKIATAEDHAPGAPGGGPRSGDDAQPDLDRQGPSKTESAVATTELMRLLRADDPSTAAWARDALRRRGFTPRHLELVMHLTDPDARVRASWARRLTSMSGVDAQRWLMWLSEDADAEVRRTAIGLLATTEDVEVLQRLADRATRDTNWRIRRQGEQIQRRLASRNVTASARSR